MKLALSIGRINIYIGTTLRSYIVDTAATASTPSKVQSPRNDVISFFISLSIALRLSTHG